ncbi:protein of unknown function [Paenibacillus alvei]|uniref:Uncharacterized protein n=1 Tax=Paenibacillus alvei TaxID=44250 RepID=A0A383R7W8_PAEAL|nr:protein of unknown function [Paenibacillus alvei]
MSFSKKDEQNGRFYLMNRGFLIECLLSKLLLYTEDSPTMGDWGARQDEELSGSTARANHNWRWCNGDVFVSTWVSCWYFV